MTFDDSTHKKCSKCGEVKERGKFYNKKSKKDGKAAHCIKCDKIMCATYRSVNKDKKREYSKRYNAENKEKRKETQSKYYKNNKKTLSIKRKEYYRNKKNT